MSSPRGIHWELLREATLLVTYYDGESADDRWDEYIRVLSQFVATPNTRFLIYTLVPPPRAAVERLLRVTRGGRWRTALVSPSLAVRFIGSTFAVAVRNLRYFPVESLAAALQHLECTPQEERLVHAALDRLQNDITPEATSHSNR